MTRKARHLLFLLLTACGGGGASAPYDPVVRVVFADVPPPANALTYFDANGTRRIEVDYSLEGDPTLPDVLRHELWHAVVGPRPHNPDPSCVSSSPAPSVFIACPVEAAEMREATATGYVEVSFPEAEQVVSEVVFWWNWSCGAAVLRVEVADD